LPQQHDLRILTSGIADEWKNRRRARVANDLHLTSRSIWKANLVDIERDDVASVDAVRCN